jgi:hypothetical protein
MPSTGKIADATAGSALIIGKCIVGSQGGTGTVCEVLLNDYQISALTTTISN